MRNDAELNQEMRRLAGAAVIDCAVRYGTTLDYTEHSLIALDRVVAKAAQQMESVIGDDQSALERQRFALSMMFGAYFGEVIRRRWGGVWIRSASLDGPVPAVALAEADVLPTEQVSERLASRTGDLTAYFAQLKARQAVA